jgi:hypothetical protein
MGDVLTENAGLWISLGHSPLVNSAKTKRFGVEIQDFDCYCNFNLFLCFQVSSLMLHHGCEGYMTHAIFFQQPFYWDPPTVDMSSTLSHSCSHHLLQSTRNFQTLSPSSF